MNAIAYTNVERTTPMPAGHEGTRGVPLAWLIAMLLGFLEVDNLLVLRFLGKPWLSVAAIMALGIPLTIFLALRFAKDVARDTKVGWRSIALCLTAAAVLLILGGEGRLFYANTDWQVRDAVLADMGAHPWPFAYQIRGELALLRAPLGMYILPALVGASSQGAVDNALLACNTLMLGLLFATGACLFTGARTRVTALALFVAFSGLDAFGTLISWHYGGHPSLDHLEWWAGSLQYSSHVTQIFWVPHHAIGGWLCTLFYLLWQQKKIGVGIFCAVIPLVAIWSPLAIMGAVPFAVLAAARTLIAREVHPGDVALTALALCLSLPSLAYLRAGADALPSGLNLVPPLLYIISELVEVGPYLIVMVALRPASRFGRDTLATVIVCLILMPLYRIGGSIDFQMRASIMPLALLAIAVADAVTRSTPRAIGRLDRGVLLIALTIGSITGAAELRRAVRGSPSPAPHCSLVGVWYKQTYVVTAPISTYLAPLSVMPTPLRPLAVFKIDVTHEPAHCWARPWRSTQA